MLTVQDAIDLSFAVVAVWAVAWGWRVLYRLL